MASQAVGLFFVVMYLVCDSFTSQWQDRIFKKHKIDQYQMMFGVNCFSIVFTCFSLLTVSQFSSLPSPAPSFLPYLFLCSPHIDFDRF